MNVTPVTVRLVEFKRVWHPMTFRSLNVEQRLMTLCDVVFNTKAPCIVLPCPSGDGKKLTRKQTDPHFPPMPTALVPLCKPPLLVPTPRFLCPLLCRWGRRQTLHMDRGTQWFQRKELDVLAHHLGSLAPAFVVDPCGVRCVWEPTDFYEELVGGIRTARQRVVLASLYLGIGEREKKLVEELRGALVTHPSLRVTLLFDSLRGTRVDCQNQSTVSMLRPVVDAFPDRVDAFFYHTPDLRGVLKWTLPQRMNETVGLTHVKACVFDEVMVMSGANLNETYFTNRLDRYYIFPCGPLADYYDQLVQTIGRFSFRQGPEGLMGPADSSVPPLTRHRAFRKAMRSEVEKLMEPRLVDCVGSRGSVENRTIVFPTIQMGPLNLRQDEEATCHCLRSTQMGARLDLSSPYFNITDKYTRCLWEGHTTHVQVITCSPKANSFYGASGLSSVIVPAYSTLERDFFRENRRKYGVTRLSMHEFVRPDWTFHAKGAWLSLSGEDHPSMTMIGSPNFGYRSVDLDLESQLIVLTQDKNLQQRMGAERDRVFRYSEEVTDDLFERDDRRASLFARLTARVFKHYF